MIEDTSWHLLFLLLLYFGICFPYIRDNYTDMYKKIYFLCFYESFCTILEMCSDTKQINTRNTGMLQPHLSIASNL